MHIQQYHSSKASTTSATSITSTTPIKEEYDKTTFSKRISEAVALIVAIILALMIGHKLSHGQNVTNHGTDWLICDFPDVFTPSILSFQLCFQVVAPIVILNSDSIPTVWGFECMNRTCLVFLSMITI